MGRKFMMAWIPSRRGWMKEYKGKKYAVSCRQLNAPESKEGSYQQANAWWTAKKGEIDLVDAPPRPGTRQAIIAFMEQFLGRPIEDERDYYRTWLGMLESPELPKGFIDAGLSPERSAQIEADFNRMMDAPAIPHDRSVLYLAERWIGMLQAQVAAGQMAPDQADNRRICLGHFTAWSGAIAVDQIDGQRLHDFYLWCLRKVEERHHDANHKAGWSSDYAKKVFATARAFIRNLCEQDLIAYLKNLDSKRYKFNGGAKQIQTWTVEEVQHVICEAPGKLKLALLLMVNCGMTQKDVSDLEDTEVDWRHGTITRKRSKTGDHDAVPTVCYRLWPCTFQLLQQYRSGQDRVLLTESGRPYVRKEMVNGELVKADNIASNYTHLKRRLKFKKSLKLLRKTAATMLESHPIYGRFTSYFLGHAPQSMKDKHYAAPSQELFDEAVSWLGQQFGFDQSSKT